jgi:hypothetical protein
MGTSTIKSYMPIFNSKLDKTAMVQVTDSELGSDVTLRNACMHLVGKLISLTPVLNIYTGTAYWVSHGFWMVLFFRQSNTTCQGIMFNGISVFSFSYIEGQSFTLNECNKTPV